MNTILTVVLLILFALAWLALGLMFGATWGFSGARNDITRYQKEIDKLTRSLSESHTALLLSIEKEKDLLKEHLRCLVEIGALHERINLAEGSRVDAIKDHQATLSKFQELVELSKQLADEVQRDREEIASLQETINQLAMKGDVQNEEHTS